MDEERQMKKISVQSEIMVKENRDLKMREIFRKMDTDEDGIISPT
jgi:hypothetical protein